MAIALWVVIFVAVPIIMMGRSSSQGKAVSCGVLVIWLILQLVGVMIIFGSLAGLAGVEFGPGGAEEASRALTSKVLIMDVIYALVGALLCYGIKKRSKLPPASGSENEKPTE